MCSLGVGEGDGDDGGSRVGRRQCSWPRRGQRSFAVGRSFSRLVVVLVCVPGCKRGSPGADSRPVVGLSLMSWMGGGARSRRLCYWPSGCFAAASVPWYFFFSVPVVSLRSSCNCSCFARFRLARSFPEEGSLIWGFQTPVLSLFSLCPLFIH